MLLNSNTHKQGVNIKINPAVNCALQTRLIKAFMLLDILYLNSLMTTFAGAFLSLFTELGMLRGRRSKSP